MEMQQGPQCARSVKITPRRFVKDMKKLVRRRAAYESKLVAACRRSCQTSVTEEEAEKKRGCVVVEKNLASALLIPKLPAYPRRSQEPRQRKSSRTTSALAYSSYEVSKNRHVLQTLFFHLVPCARNTPNQRG